LGAFLEDRLDVDRFECSEGDTILIRAPAPGEYRLLFSAGAADIGNRCVELVEPGEVPLFEFRPAVFDDVVLDRTELLRWVSSRKGCPILPSYCAWPADEGDRDVTRPALLLGLPERYGAKDLSLPLHLDPDLLVFGFPERTGRGSYTVLGPTEVRLVRGMAEVSVPVPERAIAETVPVRFRVLRAGAAFAQAGVRINVKRLPSIGGSYLTGPDGSVTVRLFPGSHAAEISHRITGRPLTSTGGERFEVTPGAGPMTIDLDLGIPE
jgi:hypothetical protein